MVHALVWNLDHDNYRAWVYKGQPDPTYRLFESPVLEALTRTRPWMIPVVWIPVATMVWSQSHWDLSHGLMGVGFWTLLEYVMHRWVFHWTNWPTLHFLIHGQHHRFPRDADRLVLPIVPVAVLVSGVGNILVKTIGYVSGMGCLAGILYGYVWYDMTHYAVHASSWLVGLREHHMRHHYHDEQFNFGVTSPLWDWVFGTWV